MLDLTLLRGTPELREPGALREACGTQRVPFAQQVSRRIDYDPAAIGIVGVAFVGPRLYEGDHSDAGHGNFMGHGSSLLRSNCAVV